VPRIEYKYFVPAWYQTRLLSDLRLFCAADPHCTGDGTGYRVASIYCENPDFRCYHEKIDGLENRFKLRIRFYPDDAQCDWLQLEIKYKWGERIQKGSVRLTRAVLARLLDGDFSDVDYQANPTLNRCFRLFKVDGFRPALRIDYEREAYFARSDAKVRVTLDHAVRVGRFDGDLDRVPTWDVYLPGAAILEIKSPGYLPFWLTRILEKYGLTRCAISKYAAAFRRAAAHGPLSL
jgi:SPX domain protein involved in polyphosphate accumulation